MSERIEFEYFYLDEAEQYSFYRIPKILFSNPVFSSISTDAKLLYGLMLDRMDLSYKNHWVDEKNRVYIYFTLEDAMRQLNCKKDKGVKLFAELDCANGIGLIERIKQGQGKPTKIYVKSFTSYQNKTSEKTKSGIRKKRSQDFGKIEANYTNENNTEKELINLQQTICKNIAYYSLIAQYEKEMIDEIVVLMLDILTSNSPKIKISREGIDAKYVKERFLKLNQFHIEYVIKCFKENTQKIYNIRQYMITLLYNSYSTKSCYYQAEVNHDLYGS